MQRGKKGKEQYITSQVLKEKQNRENENRNKQGLSFLVKFDILVGEFGRRKGLNNLSI